MSHWCIRVVRPTSAGSSNIRKLNGTFRSKLSKRAEFKKFKINEFYSSLVSYLS